MVVTVEILRQLLNFESTFLNILLTYHAVFLISVHLLMCSSGKFRIGRQFSRRVFKDADGVYICTFLKSRVDIK